METLNTISTYTNEQAIADGYKVRVSRPDLHDFNAPVFLTSSVVEILNKGDYGIRELAMLSLVREAMHVQLMQKPHEYFFTATYNPVEAEYLLWCILDGDGFTVMLPSDY